MKYVHDIIKSEKDEDHYNNFQVKKHTHAHRDVRYGYVFLMENIKEIKPYFLFTVVPSGLGSGVLFHSALLMCTFMFYMKSSDFCVCLFQ